MKAVRDTTEKLRRDHIILLERYSSLEKENERIKTELLELKNDMRCTDSNKIDDNKRKNEEMLEAAQKEIQSGIEEKLERDKIIKSLKNAKKTMETHLFQSQDQILKLKTDLKSSEEDVASLINVVSDLKQRISDLEHEIKDLDNELKEKDMVIPKTIEVDHIAIQVQIEYDEKKSSNDTAFEGKKGLLISDIDDNYGKEMINIGCQTEEKKEKKVVIGPTTDTVPVSIHKVPLPIQIGVSDANSQTTNPPSPPFLASTTTTPSPPPPTPATTTPTQTRKDSRDNGDEVNFAAFIKLKKENRDLKLHIAQMATK